MLRNMEPPLGFGNKCPYRLAYKKLIRMNMPLTEEGKVNFTSTLFALIRENLSIKMRPAEEMDMADKELRVTIQKLWPLQAEKVTDKLVPPDSGEYFSRCKTNWLFYVCTNYTDLQINREQVHGYICSCVSCVPTTLCIILPDLYGVYKFDVPELRTGKLTVGKVYGGLLILENWRAHRFQVFPGAGLFKVQVCLFLHFY